MSKSSKISINKAFCIELNRDVSVKELEAELQSLKPLSNPHFYCSTDACKNKKIQISVIGYEQRRRGFDCDMPVHFRTFPKQYHIDGCQWSSKPKQPNDDTLNQEAPIGITHRPHNPKINSTINYFFLNLDDEPSEHNDNQQCTNGIIDNVQVSQQPSTNSTNQRTTTHSFDRLVDEFLGLEEQGNLNMPLVIKGLGSATYYDFFKPHQRITHNFEKFILFGSLTRYCKQNDDSFYLYFFDKFNNKKIDLYINFNDYEDDRKKEQLLKTLTEMETDQVKFYRAFFIATDRVVTTRHYNKQGRQVIEERYHYKIPNLNYLQLIRVDQT